jgi:serine/threonine protein kinase
MTVTLCCHHGHELQILEPLDARQAVACPVCGSITKLRPANETKRPGSVDATVDSVANSDAEPRASSEEAEVASGVAEFQTIDYSHSSADERSSEKEPDQELEPPSLTGYQVLDELGRGGMGVVYRALDQGGREVALKTLQRMSPDGLQRFKQEFRTLANIAHPNLASPYELLSDGLTWCFTMELLEGVDFLEFVWSGFEGLESDARRQPVPVSSDAPRLSEEQLERLESALAQLVVALNALHESGVLHSDIKPSNVLMTKEGRLVLLDFGLAAEIRKRDANERRVVQGTPLYMAPEQAAGGSLSHASDWYAVGVILYEVLTGGFPFTGNTVRILSRKQSETALQPDCLAPHTPQYLNELCVALLDRDPRQRPAATDILRRLGNNDAASAIAAQHQPAVIHKVELVGRERHLAVLEEAFKRVSADNTCSIFVHGKSGMGKSVLVRSFLDGIKQRQEAVVLEGRCYEQESVPFKALDSLIDSLTAFLGTLPEESIHSVMPRDRLAVTRVFPVLGGLPEMAHATYPSIADADMQELRQRAMNALRELLQRLAIRGPLVLYVDDLQWGDADSADLLADLVRPPDAPRMLLLASYRSEDIEASVCLQELHEAYQRGRNQPHREELAVDALTQDEATQLALMLLGRDNESSQVLATKIAHESGGWPFFVWELAQHVRDDSSIADRTLDLDEVIWLRVNRLPPATICMLELIAVAGRPMPASEIYQALDARSDGTSLLAQLRASNLVRTTESEEDADTMVESYHDRIRESVYNHLDTERVQRHSLTLARMIESVSGISTEELQDYANQTSDYDESHQPYDLERRNWQRVFDLAYFFDAAGDVETALLYALLAAEQARSQDAMDVAEQQYRIALRGSSHADPAICFRVREGLGGLLMARGKYALAEEQLQAALALAKGNHAQARIEGKLGFLEFKRGAMGNVARHVERAFGLVGERSPKSRIGQVMALLKEVIVQVLHTYMPHRYVGRKSVDTPQGQRDLFCAPLYEVLSLACWFVSGPVPLLLAHLKHMNLAERYPPSTDLAKAYSFHAVVITALPNARRGDAYGEKAYRIGRDKDDLWCQGRARSLQTFSLIAAGRFQKGVETGREAVQLLEQAGDVWEANMARIIWSYVLYYIGDLRTAQAEAKRAYEIGKETGDVTAMAISVCFWAYFGDTSVPEGAIKVELERERNDPLAKVMAVQGRGMELLLCEDDPLEAARVLEESLTIAARHSLRNVCVFSAVSWKATALRIAAEREQDSIARRNSLRRAKKAIRAALKTTRSYLQCRSQALRERGKLAVIESNERQARRYFDESLQVAEEQNAAYEHAKTLLARGEAAVQFGWPQGTAKIADAQAAIRALEDS